MAAQDPPSTREGLRDRARRIAPAGYWAVRGLLVVVVIAFTAAAFVRLAGPTHENQLLGMSVPALLILGGSLMGMLIQSSHRLRVARALQASPDAFATPVMVTKATTAQATTVASALGRAQPAIVPNRYGLLVVDAAGVRLLVGRSPVSVMVVPSSEIVDVRAATQTIRGGSTGSLEIVVATPGAREQVSFACVQSVKVLGRLETAPVVGEYAAEARKQLGLASVE